MSPPECACPHLCCGDGPCDGHGLYETPPERCGECLALAPAAELTPAPKVIEL